MRDAPQARRMRSRWRAGIAANPRGAIYGTIVAMGVIAAAALVTERPGIILAETTATLIVFWLAHVYADLIVQTLDEGKRDLKAVPAAMARELSMVAAPALSIVFLLLGTLGVLDEGVAVGLALWNGVAQLVGWGITVERRLRRSWPAALLGGAVNGALGLVIVVLEAGVH